MSGEKFDYIIVGAGSAGCVLANRLSANPAITVLLLEAGPDHPPEREPAAIRDPYPVSLGHLEFCWPGLIAEVGPDPSNGKPRHSRHYLQGRGIGGGSNVQGMVALRGLPSDYDAWRDAGAAGWGWDDVLPYFRRLERDLDFDGPLHGRDGPIPIRRIPPEQFAPFARAFADCARARGYPLIEDFNADFRAGVGPLPMANLPDRRVSASMGYLTQDVRCRRNLAILSETHVERIEVKSGRVVGVSAKHAGERKRFTAREVIVSAGALHSPAVLMRSGIGPGAHLQQHGIQVVRDLPAVGQHLMNHVNLSIATHLKRHAMQPSPQRGFGQSCLQFSTGIDGPDIDTLMVAINKSSWHSLGDRIGALAIEIHKIHSRGTVHLRSADPAVPPQVKFNLLSDERDLARLLVALRLCLDIFSDDRMAQVSNELFLPDARRVAALRKRTSWNGLRASAIAAIFDAGTVRRKLLGRSRIDARRILASPDDLRKLALERAGPPHHVSCTCRIGRTDDGTAVVDRDCRVFGVQGLYVVDASVMPTLVRANTHLPVLMIAEKMAHTLLAKR